MEKAEEGSPVIPAVLGKFDPLPPIFMGRQNRRAL
jgi:hypothetical protein